jgi:hypothetical protein
VSLKTLNFSTLGPISSHNPEVIVLKTYIIVLKFGGSTIVSRVGSRELIPLCPSFLKLGIQFHDLEIFFWVRSTYLFDTFVLLMDEIHKTGVVLVEFQIFKLPFFVLALEFSKFLGHARNISQL